MGHPVIEAIINASRGGSVLETHRDVAEKLETKLKPKVPPIMITEKEFEETIKSRIESKDRFSENLRHFTKMNTLMQEMNKNMTMHTIEEKSGEE